MAIGPGKFDDWCTKIREDVHAHAVIVIVMGATRESTGMSAQCRADVADQLDVPKILRAVADQLDALESQEGGMA